MKKIPSKNQETWGIAAMIMASLFVVGNNAIAKLLAAQINPLSVIYWRMLLAAGFAWLLFKHKINWQKIFSAKPSQIFMLFFVGIFNSAIAVFLRVLALMNTTLLNVSIIHTLIPLLVYLYSIFIFKNKFNLKIIGLILISIYAVIILSTNSLFFQLGKMGKGELLVAGATLITALGYVVRKILLKSFNTFEVSLPAFLISGLTLLVMDGTTNQFDKQALWDWQTGFLLVLSGFLACLGIILTNQSIKQLRSTTASQGAHVKVIFAFGLGWFVFGEMPTIYSLIAAMIIIGSIYLSNREQKKLKMI
ncbi:MAG: EamA family transporter [Candidatus Moranbacteria bacterium]|nr:EamA family transporter [Candidatus Moranbacteria bacterium]